MLARGRVSDQRLTKAVVLCFLSGSLAGDFRCLVPVISVETGVIILELLIKIGVVGVPVSVQFDFQDPIVNTLVRLHA